MYPKAPIGNIAANLFIYETEAGIFGPSQDKPFEQWDVLAPADLNCGGNPTLSSP